MALILAPDIFGRTPELEDFVADLGPNSGDVTIIDPYEEHSITFDNEAKAYAFVIEPATCMGS